MLRPWALLLCLCSGFPASSSVTSVHDSYELSASLSLSQGNSSDDFGRTPGFAPPTSRRRATTNTSNATNTAEPISDIWVIQKVYQGQDFFKEWNFATYADPTRGQVQYVSREWATSSGMVYINDANQAVMQVDNWSTLAQGQSRNSVRIDSAQLYQKGLFILDVEHAPWGCGVWPAWWTVGPSWPAGGEIDVLEGVHDNVHNQVTFHTADGCYLNQPSKSTPSAYNSTGEVIGGNCYAYGPGGQGCATIDPSQASYGTQFNVLKGGIFAMLWTDDSVRVWFFHRAAIPADVLTASPKPSTWGVPVAYLGDKCDIEKYFYNHTIVFDITFCGDWAGPSYISSGCPGTCSDRIMDPQNFMNASWTINSLRVYRNAQVASSTGRDLSPSMMWMFMIGITIAMFLVDL